MMEFVNGLNVLLSGLDEEVFANSSLGRDRSVWGQTLNLHLVLINRL